MRAVRLDCFGVCTYVFFRNLRGAQFFFRCESASFASSEAGALRLAEGLARRGRRRMDQKRCSFFSASSPASFCKSRVEKACESNGALAPTRRGGTYCGSHICVPKRLVSSDGACLSSGNLSVNDWANCHHIRKKAGMAAGRVFKDLQTTISAPPETFRGALFVSKE